MQFILCIVIIVGRVKKIQFVIMNKPVKTFAENGENVNINSLQIYRHPLLINYILEIIVKHLGLSDLKPCRLVHKVWNEEAKKRLKMLAVIRFKLQDSNLSNAAHCNTNWKERVNEYVSMKENFYFQNFSVLIGGGIKTSKSLKRNKALNKLFKAFGNQVQYLELIVRFEGQQEVEAFSNILKSVSNLTYLKLKLKTKANAEDYDEYLKPCLINWDYPLLSVKNVEIDNLEGKTCLPLRKDFFKFLITLIPNLQSIQITWDKRQYHKTPYISSYPNVKLEEELPPNDTRFVKLTEIIIKHPLSENSNTFLDGLVNSNFHLTKLQLNLNLTAYSFRSNFKTLLQTVLETQADTLEKLYLEINVNQPTCVFDKPPKILMPVFLKLKKLEIIFEIRSYTLFDFIFESGELDYEIQFPKLEELTIGGDTVMLNESCYRRFIKMYNCFLLPDCEKVFSKLQYLDIKFYPVFGLDNLSHNTYFFIKLLPQLKYRFPNASIKHYYISC